jgi:glyoxylase-like metal-dependent hydrolase (beta-lactamase superfamily II)
MRTILFFLALGASVTACKQPAPEPFSSINFDLTELAPGVYACIHRIGGKAICNAGIVDNGKETFIFDTFLSPGVAAELPAAVEKLDLSPIRYVVYSHAHNVHIRGNQVFGEGVKIISTKKSADLIAEWEPQDIEYEKEAAPARYAYYDSLYQAFDGDTASREYTQIMMWRPYYEILSNSHREVRTRLPDTFVDGEMVFEGPERTVRLLTKGSGHTESDLVMYLPKDRILFSGDLVFNDCHPYVAHGSLSGWHGWLAFLKTLDITTIVPGHGPVGTKDELNEMDRYLSDLESHAAGLVEAGASEEEIAAEAVPQAYGHWWFDRFYAYNLGFACQQAGKSANRSN